MYTITKQFAFEAAHQLTGLPEDHPCMRLHGHSYRVEVVIQSVRLNEIGFVYDYRALDPIKNLIDEQLDHQNLNNVLAENPTAENIARWLYLYIIKLQLPGLGLKEFGPGPYLQAVRISETQKTWAEFSL